MLFIATSRLRRKAKIACAATVVGVCTTFVGTTQAEFKDRLYLGLGLAGSTLEPVLEGSDFVVDDTSDSGWNVLLGYQFNSRWRAELDYSYLGEARLSPTSSLAYTDYNASALYNVWQQNAFGGHKNLSLFGRLGVGTLKGESELNIVEDSSVQILFGLGADINFNSKVALRAETVRYDTDASRIGLSLLYRFGKHSEPTRTVIATTTTDIRANDVLTAEPTIAAAVTRTPQHECFNVSTNFGYNEYRLLESQKKELNDLIQGIDATRAIISIVGHTDSLGSIEYNRKLSLKRAHSVQQYLVANGMKRHLLEIDGSGESRPIAKNTSEIGRVSNRRVELKITAPAGSVELTGFREANTANCSE